MNLSERNGYEEFASFDESQFRFLINRSSRLTRTREYNKPPAPSPEPAMQTTAIEHEHGYDDFQEALLNRTLRGPVFTTHVDDLFDTFLGNLPHDQQHYNCYACKRFFNTYGALVRIEEDGRTVPALWEGVEAPPFFRDAIEAIARKVSKAAVTGVFLSKETVWGRPTEGGWSHFAVRPPETSIYLGGLLTPDQEAARIARDFWAVRSTVNTYERERIDQAVTLLESGALYRGDQIAGPARWLRDLRTARESLRGAARDAVTWLAVATAPKGYPNGSVLKTLLEDLADGSFNFEEVKRRFNAKMNPLTYQRPTTAPTAQNIEAAEKVVEKLGIARSLERRFARLDEIQAIWRPTEQERVGGAGVFGHLKAKGEEAESPMILPPTTMTWEKFRRTVLPDATSIDLMVKGRDNFTALVTAAHPDAPLLFKWDNPFSWYVYHGGSLASHWGLSPNTYQKVSAISLKPDLWGVDATDRKGQGVILLLEKARESRFTGNALFPENVRSELHGVRSVIEAYSKSARISEPEDGSACGLMLQQGGSWDVGLRVCSGGMSREYRLDRWD